MPDIRNEFPAKIALFLPSLSGGGAERVMLNLAIGLTSAGREAQLVLASAKGALLPRVPATIRIIDLSAGRMITSLVPLIRYLRAERPDVLLAAMDHSNLLAIWAAKLAGVDTRIVVSVHTLRSLVAGGSVPAREKLLSPLAKRFYPQADRILAVSDAVADDLAEQLGFEREMIDTIYNPIVASGFKHQVAEEVVHPWFEPGAPPVILGIGRLAKEKDFPTLISAFELILKNTKARLMILGEGPERSRLQELIVQKNLQDVVELFGFVANPLDYLRCARVFALSSSFEGLPTVVIEAMYCGTPVVATRCPGGVAEIMRGGELGPLVTVGDWQALANAIMEVMENPVDSARLQARANDFSIDVITHQYLALFAELE